MKNVHYINAGAGAGKTYTLVTILKDILTDKKNPCAPSEIILTTYTKAAAKEFREKTFKRLLEAPAALDVAKILDTATIGTVHSVAQQYIQRYWSLLGYSGQFNVMADVDKKRYINQSLKKAVNHADLTFFYEFTKDFNLTHYDATKDRNIVNYDFWKDYVLEIVSKMRAYNIKRNQLKNFAQKSCDVVDRLFAVPFDQKVLETKIKIYSDFLDIKSRETKKDGTPSANALTNKGRLDIYFTFKTISSPTADEISDFIESDCFKASVDKLPAEKQSKNDALAYLKCFLALAKADPSRVKDCINRIFTIAENWSQQFKQYKRENNLLDFDDLEAKFLELLGYKEVQEDINKSIKYVFVDEFQDSNPIQLEIFKKLSDLVQVKSYWVGDRKQAIYGFRGSDSSLTTNLLKSFPDPVPGQTSGFVPNADGCTSQLIDTSYRSFESLVELANKVFEKSFAFGDPSEIIDNVPLQVKRPDGNIQTPIQHWHCSSVDALADRVAEILNGNVSEFPGVYDEDDNWGTTIVPADIAVLSRTKADSTKVEEALRKKGIPVSSPETSILDKAEIKLVLALLKYVASIHRRYAKTELAKLLEDKEIGTILKEIADGRYDYKPFFDDDPDAGDEKNADSAATAEGTTGKPTKKDPDPLFADLNDKLQGLRGLSISAIVKGVIAVMDVRNIVAKWSNAEIRQDNLDTLIEHAIKYEQSTANSIESATVAGFLNYMEEVEIQSELDQSAEGVKVATYHKSKGLQWKIVILNSLDDDELELANFVKKNWFGLNLRGDYDNAELQLIPNCGDVTDAVAEAVLALSNQSAGNDDNGYYKMIHGKVEGEIKRLLYVGVTRARDYLITISMPDGYGKIQPLAWVKNIIGSAELSKWKSSSILDAIDQVIGSTDVELWGDSTHPAYYEQLTDLGNTYSGSASTHVKLDSVAISTETTPMRISPSGSHEKYDATAAPVKGFSSQYIDHDSNIDDYAAFGTCIHNYFAVHRWEGKNNRDANKQANIDLAIQTVKNHNMTKILYKPELLTQAADALFTYLEDEYGAGELLRETPFTHHRDNRQLVSGEIDLVWKTEKECILLDYKNFPAEQSYGQKVIFDDAPDNKNFVGKYFQQLDYYRTALKAAGMTVTKVFVFYAVLGCLVEVKF